jgi:hypothetical protein
MLESREATKEKKSEKHQAGKLFANQFIGKELFLSTKSS